MKKGIRVSEAVIRRLPRYYRYLHDLERKGVERISSSALGEAMGLTASQIRQDLFCFGEFGQQGYGYRVESLKAEISKILGIDRGHTAILLGAGNLGRALMQNFHFSFYGVRMLAAFDTNPAIIGSTIGDVPIYHVAQLEQYLAENPVSVAVLTVPQAFSQSTAQRVVAAGIRGIWNFTNVELVLNDESVVVESVHFSDSLLALSYMISREAPPSAGQNQEETAP